MRADISRVSEIKKANWGRKREGSGGGCKGPVEGTEARKRVLGRQTMVVKF